MLINDFGGMRQLALVVRDAEAAMAQLTASLGVGPFHVVRNFVPANYRYRGESVAPPVLTLCFGQAGPVQIEVIQQHNDAASAYRDFLGAGLEGCQHMAVWFDNSQEYDLARVRAIESGLILVHEGEGGPPRARFAYFSIGLPGAFMLELAEALLPGVRELPELVAASSKGWDGKDPVRYLN